MFLDRRALESFCAMVERLCIYLGAEVLLLLLSALFDPRKAYFSRETGICIYDGLIFRFLAHGTILRVCAAAGSLN